MSGSKVNGWSGGSGGWRGVASIYIDKVWKLSLLHTVDRWIVRNDTGSIAGSLTAMYYDVVLPTSVGWYAKAQQTNVQQHTSHR